jgi:hypothetical protein
MEKDNEASREDGTGRRYCRTVRGIAMKEKGEGGGRTRVKRRPRANSMKAPALSRPIPLRNAGFQGLSHWVQDIHSDPHFRPGQPHTTDDIISYPAKWV